jgi:hypothetical protein
MMSAMEWYFIHLFKCSAMNTEYDQKMFEVVERTIDCYKMSAEKSDFIQKCIIEKRSWKKACDEFHIERRTYFAWREEILSDAVICAIANKLIDLSALLI